MNDTRRRPRAATLAFVGAGLMAGLVAVAAFHAWSNRSTIDPHALDLLRACDARFENINAVQGETFCTAGNGLCKVVMFRLMRPSYARIRAIIKEQNPPRSLKTVRSVLETHWDGAISWRVRGYPGEENDYARLDASSLRSQLDDFGDDTLFAALFAKKLFAGATHYGWLTKPGGLDKSLYVQYQGRRTWRGAIYDEVQIREIKYEAPPVWNDVRSGGCTIGDWALGRVRPAPLTSCYEQTLFISADRLVYKKTCSVMVYNNGVSHRENFAQIELRSVRINPPLTAVDFRYAPPAASVKAVANP